METVTQNVDTAVAIKKAQAADLLTILSNASRQKKMPLKFCLAQNIKKLQEPVTAYLDDKEALFKAAVVLDDEGNGVVKEEYKEQAAQMGGRVPYGMFEYSSEEAMKEFNEKLKELNNEEIKVDFVKERADRVIKVSDQEGNYVNSTIQEVLEDPNNEVTPAMITLFIEYFLEV